MSVHLVAGIAQEGLGGLTGLLGKRGVFDDLITSAQSSLYQMLNQAVQSNSKKYLTCKFFVEI